MKNKKYPIYKEEEFQVYKCKNCGKEVIPGEMCCKNRHYFQIPGKKIIRKTYKAKPNYEDCLSELRRSGKLKNACMITH